MVIGVRVGLRQTAGHVLAALQRCPSCIGSSARRTVRTVPIELRHRQHLQIERKLPDARARLRRLPRTDRPGRHRSRVATAPRIDAHGSSPAGEARPRSPTSPGPRPPDSSRAISRSARRRAPLTQLELESRPLARRMLPSLPQSLSPLTRRGQCPRPRRSRPKARAPRSSTCGGCPARRQRPAQGAARHQVARDGQASSGVLTTARSWLERLDRGVAIENPRAQQRPHRVVWPRSHDAGSVPEAPNGILARNLGHAQQRGIGARSAVMCA